MGILGVRHIVHSKGVIMQTEIEYFVWYRNKSITIYLCCLEKRNFIPIDRSHIRKQLVIPELLTFSVKHTVKCLHVTFTIYLQIPLQITHKNYLSRYYMKHRLLSVFQDYFLVQSYRYPCSAGSCHTAQALILRPLPEKCDSATKTANMVSRWKALIHLKKQSCS